VFDLIGGEIGKRSARLVRAGGTLVSVVGPSEARPADGLAVDFVVEPDRSQLGEIVQRVRDGRLRTNIGTVASLDDGVSALNSTTRRTGKTSSALALKQSRSAPKWSIHVDEFHDEVDWLSQLLKMITVSGQVQVRCVYGAPWRVAWPQSAAHEIPYHIVLKGRAILQSPGAKMPTSWWVATSCCCPWLGARAARWQRARTGAHTQSPSFSRLVAQRE
jgi:hypothetical protein